MINVLKTPPLPPLLTSLDKAVAQNTQANKSTSNVVFNTKEIQTPPPFMVSLPSDATMPTLTMNDAYKDNADIDYRDLKKLPPVPFITKDKKDLLDKGISVNIKHQDKEVTILPKELMDKVKTATRTNQSTVSIKNEDTTTYKLVKSPPSSGILVMRNEQGITREIGMPPVSLEVEKMASSKEMQEHKNNIAKMSVMSKMPFNIDSFYKVSEDVYKTGDTFAKVEDGAFIYRGFRF